MSILHTILYTFPKVLTRRICFKQLRASLVGDYFLFLMTSICDQGVICKEKLDASHSLVLGFKGLSDFSFNFFPLVEVQNGR